MPSRIEWSYRVQERASLMGLRFFPSVVNEINLSSNFENEINLSSNFAAEINLSSNFKGRRVRAFVDLYITDDMVFMRDI